MGVLYFHFLVLFFAGIRLFAHIIMGGWNAMDQMDLHLWFPNGQLLVSLVSWDCCFGCKPILLTIVFFFFFCPPPPSFLLLIMGPRSPPEVYSLHEMCISINSSKMHKVRFGIIWLVKSLSLIISCFQFQIEWVQSIWHLSLLAY